MELDNLKREYETYCECLAKYNMPTLAHNSITADELFHKELQLSFKLARGFKESINVTCELLFGDEEDTKKTKTEVDIEYYQRLICHAKNKINGMPQKIRIQIVKDAISLTESWSQQFDYNSRLNKRLKEEKKAKSKATPKKQRRTSKGRTR